MTKDDFTQNVLRMQGTLYRVSSSILRQRCDQEDAVQSSIEIAWRKREHLRDPGKFGPWLTRILINECYGILRRRRDIPLAQVPDCPAPPSADPDLYRFFVSLPEKLRLPMVLHYVEGYAIRDIADALHLPQGTVKTRLMRGRERMKQDRCFEEVQDL